MDGGAVGLAELDSQFTASMWKVAESKRSGRWRSGLLSAVFFLLFNAFLPAQNVTSVLYPDLGTVSLGLVYSFFCLGSAFTPLLMGLKARLRFFIAGAVFTLWLVATLLRITSLYLVASVLQGLAAGLLWVSQGVYIKRASPATFNVDSQLFFSVMFSAHVTGNLLGGFVLKELDVTRFLAIMISLSGAGALLALFLPDVDPLPTERKHASPGQALLAPWRLFPGNWWRLLILPHYMFHGATLSYSFVAFPIQVFSITRTLDSIPFVFLAYGGMLVLMSILLMRVFDGESFWMYVASAIGILSVGLSIAVPFTSYPYPLLYVVAGLFGAGESLYNAVSNHQTSVIFAEDLPSGFTHFRIWMNISVGVLALLAGPFATTTIGVIVLVFDVVALACLFLLNRTILAEIPNK